jgi:hypothetical protein
MPSEATDLDPLSGRTGDVGGTLFRAECRAGSYLVGFAGRAGDWIDRLSIACAPWGSGQLGPIEVHEGYFGESAGGGEAFAFCPDGAVVGPRHRKRYTGFQGTQATVLLHAIFFDCTPVVDGAVGWTGMMFGSSSDVTSPGSVPAPQDWDSCPEGELAIGIHGYEGLFIDALGLVCGPGPVDVASLPPPPPPPSTGPVSRLPDDLILAPGGTAPAPTPPAAEDPTSSLFACAGGGNMTAVAGADGLIRVFFGYAAQGSAIQSPGAGECAWSERPFSAGEPSMLVYPASGVNAQGLVQAARPGGTFIGQAYNNGQGALVVTALQAVTVASLPASQPRPERTRTPTEILGVAIVTQQLNVRAGPSTQAPVLARLEGGAAVEIAECQGNWCRLAQLVGNRPGWVSRLFLRF